ncbi:MAG: mechanosensitive ion channel domain-containing protein [Pseudomonadota bacterium]
MLDIMLENLSLTEIKSDLLAWFQGEIWTIDFGVQFVMVALAFVLGYLAKNILKPRLNEQINKLSAPFRLSEMLYNCLKLVFPLLTIAFLLIQVQIATTIAPEISTKIAIAFVKLLFAWMFIRVIAQFIENKFARNVIVFSVVTLLALSIFGVLEQTMTTLDAIGFSLGESRISLLIVLKGLFIIFILLYSAMASSKLFEKKISQTRSLPPSSRLLISKIVKVTLIVAALLIGLTSAGIDLSLFAVFSGAVGLGIGFGLQKVISNLFSGMLLLMDQSIKPGDIIEMDGTFGWVNHMGARYTELVTRDNKSYLVPNEEFITQQVINWSHGNTLVRVETEFGVHYDSDPYEVRRLAIEAAGKPERVVDSPSPVCHLIEFGDSSLNFVLRYWIKDAEKGIVNTKGDVMIALWDILKENDIQIPYPHREVFVHKS